VTSKGRVEIIFDKYREYTDNYILLYNPKKLISTMTPKEEAKELALIAVNRIIAEYNRIDCYNFVLEIEYWQQVKTKIEAL
jgi:hypothetical protein